VIQDVMVVGEYGLMSVMTDPTGATFALWEAKNPVQGGD
jgi:predicted enzyme related to lactoylglutathione lyase